MMGNRQFVYFDNGFVETGISNIKNQRVRQILC